jgi:hypothetical protein
MGVFVGEVASAQELAELGVPLSNLVFAWLLNLSRFFGGLPIHCGVK